MSDKIKIRKLKIPVAWWEGYFTNPWNLVFVVKVTKVKSLLRAWRPIKAGAYLRIRSMKRLGVFMLLPGWDANPSQGYPQHYAGTHLYTWVERSTVRVKCLAQEHNTMSPARPRTRTTRSGVEHTNHEATVPPIACWEGYFTNPWNLVFEVI